MGHYKIYDDTVQESAEVKAEESSEGVKFDGDKVRTDLYPPDAYEMISQVYTFGAKKYSAHNWSKGMDWSRLIGAAERHLLAFKKGEDLDPESGLPHLAHLGCCISMLLSFQARKDMDKFDDRQKLDLNDFYKNATGKGTE